MRLLRRISQIIFLLFFIWLFLQAAFPYTSAIPADLFLRASPLVALTTMLSARAFIGLLIPALIILLLTIPLGRFFCGWLCPLGTLIDGNDNLIKRARKKKGQRDTLRFRWIKFALLVLLVVAAIFSLQWVWFLDPIALLTRTFSVFIFPMFAWVVNSFINGAMNVPFLADPAYSLHSALQGSVLTENLPRMSQSIVIGLVFITILALGLHSRRFWCRNLCPLGALLGLFSKYRLTRRWVSTECNSCGICQLTCKTNAIEDDYSVNSAVECIECMECVAQCPKFAVSYSFGKPSGLNTIDLSRRRLLKSGLTGLLTLGMVKTAVADKNESAKAIRPPGALPEPAFLDRCIRCHECTRICSTTGACLHPSLLEGGWEAIWAPIAKMRLGYCEYSCNLCGQVCPTGAIQNLELEQKKHTVIGLAHFDKNRCIPWYRFQNCLVCEEHCPLPDKAIKFDEHEAILPDGSKKPIKFPYVREDLCIGCGICEAKCPVAGASAVIVERTNETRARDQEF